MKRTRWEARYGIGLVLALVLAACGGGTSDPVAEGDDAGADGASGADGGECSRDALEAAAAVRPLEITFWHYMTDTNKDALENLVAEFEDSQDLVRVRLVDNNSQSDQQEKYRADLGTNRLPDLVQHQEIFLQEMIDTDSALPMQACIDAESYDLSDYLPRTINYFEVEDVQWAMPFAINTPVLIYNRAVFEEAGLDPDRPPETLEELYDTAAELAAAAPGDLRAGMGLKRDPWHMEQFLALQGQPLLDNGNGRDGRATEVLFDDDDGTEIFTVLNDMVAEGLAITNPTEGGSGFDNMLGVGSGDFAMTFETSGALGLAQDLLDAGQYAGIEPGVAPLPGRSEDGGALLGGSSLYISTPGGPAEAAAAWELAKFLTSPESQSVWAADTGFIPVRESAIELPELDQRWDEAPYFRVAYDQLLEGAENDATAGPVMGTYRAYREMMEEIARKMFLGDLTPEEAVAEAAEKANDLLETYNEDVMIGVDDE